MRIVNTTANPTIPDYAVRRAASFICRQLNLPVRRIRQIRIANRLDGGTSGRCWIASGRLHISVGIVTSSNPDNPEYADGVRPAGERFAWGDDVRQIRGPAALRMRTRKMFGVLAHEIAHRSLYLAGAGKNRAGAAGCCEASTQWHANVAIRAFEADADALLSGWLTPPARVARAAERAAATSAVDRRDARDRELLAVWERKLKTAKTKVRKYADRIKRRERGR